MDVLNFHPDKNFIETDDWQTNFFLTTLEGITYALPNCCPHRRGPLRLGSATAGSSGPAIRCFSHGTLIAVRWLRNNALPLIERQGGLFTAVLPDGLAAPRAIRKLILVDLRNSALCTPAVASSDNCGGCSRSKQQEEQRI